MQRFDLETVDSTNDAARRLVAEGRIGRCALVTAREQTAGRGTNGRRWASPRDAGIYLSLVVCDLPPFRPELVHCTLAAGIGCAEAIERETGLRIRLKLVNDLMADGGKLGGILVEADLESDRVSFLATGVGINTHEAARDVARSGPRPISLQRLLDSDRFAALDAGRLVTRLVERIRFWQGSVFTGDVAALRRTWESWCEPDAAWPSG